MAKSNPRTCTVQDGSSRIEANPRYMWRFMCYRTTEPATSSKGTVIGTDTVVNLQDPASVPLARASQVINTCVMNGKKDEMTGAILERGGEAELLYNVCESVLSWVRGEVLVPQSIDIDQIDAVTGQLLSKGAENEPTRIAAAYKLGTLCNSVDDDRSRQAVAALTKAMTHSWEGVRRAATHGLIASGGYCCAAEQALMKLCVSLSAHSQLRRP